MKTELVELIEKNRKKESRQLLEKQVKDLIKEVETRDRIIEAYKSYTPNKVKIIKKENRTADKEGTVITLLSDIHAEHKIIKSTTSGINEYSPDICSDRLSKYFRILVNLTELKRGELPLDNLVMGLLGDLIHGFIHGEYLRTNYMTPLEAMLFIVDELKSGFNYILQHGQFKNIVVVCKIGNHSRITDKVYTDEEALYSYEWVIYHLLAHEFQNKIKFIIENGYFTYYQIYDKTLRFHHGHGFRYAGGIGGLYVPLQRYRLKVNQQRRADLGLIGHWHTTDFLRNTKTLINGSVCGFDAYAMRFGFEPEPPQQQFLIQDSKRGFTINTPIILE